MSARGGIATAWASELVRGLASAGVDRFFVSPGSRSTPLALAAARLDGDRASPVVDERSAAFAALGHARVTGWPAAVIATSGSAPAHWYPAVIEADEASVPLVLLSADRPIELQACGAPQTTDQERLFGAHVRRSFELGAPDAAALDRLGELALRAVVAATAPRPGPVHVNAKFRKPLEPTDEPPVAPSARAAAAIFPGLASPSPEAVRFVAEAIERAERPCAVVGPTPFSATPRADATASLKRAIALLRSRGVAVLAEAASGLLGGEGGASALGPALESGLFDRAAPDLVLELGLPPVASAYATFAAGAARRIVVSPWGALDPFGHAAAFVLADPAALAEAVAGALAPLSGGYVRLAEAAVRAAEAAVRLALARDRDGTELGEPFVARAIARAQPARGLLLLGNSLVVRDFDRYGASELAPGVEVLHQRGASGIDGLFAGAAGARLAVSPDVPVTVVLGDVSAVHDVGSLATVRALADGRGPLAVVVVDNAGGRIFDELPIGRGALDPEVFDRFYRTPPPRGFLEHAARAFSIPHVTAGDPRSLEAALGAAVAGPGVTVVEASTPAEAGRRGRRALSAVCRAAGAEVFGA